MCCQYAGVAQSVVHLIRNQKVVRSSRITSLIKAVTILWPFLFIYADFLLTFFKYRDILSPLSTERRTA